MNESNSKPFGVTAQVSCSEKGDAKEARATTPKGNCDANVTKEENEKYYS